MKSSIKNSIPAIFLLIFACTASATDLRSLDRISVLMPKSQVLSILGAPDKVTDMGGLMVDLYMVHQAAPLESAGYFYEKDLVLAGHTFIFKGNVVVQTATRLMAHGFTIQEEKGEYIRLIGKDDDTGRPVIVTISRMDELTTVTTFAKEFYERRAN